MNTHTNQKNSGPARSAFSIADAGGYTIIETMIAVSLFLVVVMAGMGSLLNANLLHDKSHDMRSIMDNLSFIMEDISRNIRTGYTYRCFTASDDIPAITTNDMSVPRSCPSGGWAIAFESDIGAASNDGVTDIKDNDQWVYYVQNGKIFKSTSGPYAFSSFIQLTPDEVVIDPVSGSYSPFTVIGAEPPPGNTEQPYVTIRIKGTITLKGVVTPFSLQTGASQRLIDV